MPNSLTRGTNVTFKYIIKNVNKLLTTYWWSWKRTLLVYHNYILFPDLDLFCLCLRGFFYIAITFSTTVSQNTKSWSTEHLVVQRKVFHFATNYCLSAVLTDLKEKLKNLRLEEWSNQAFEFPEQPKLLLLLKEGRKQVRGQL